MSQRLAASVQTAYAAIRRRTAIALVAAAIELSVEHQRRLNTGNPAPHTSPAPPGSYPRKRTGNLQASVLVMPPSPSEVERLGFVDVGHAEAGFYGEALAARGWKGLADTAAELRERLGAKVAAVSGGGAG